MKKIASYILGFVCVAAMLLACAQNADGSANALWSLGCILVSALCGWGYVKLNPQIFRYE